MGMFSVGLEHSCLVVVVDALVDGDVVSVVVVNDVVLFDTVPVVEVVPGFGLLSVLSTTMSTRTFTGVSCICTLFTISVPSSSMVLMKSYCSGSLQLALDPEIHLGPVSVDPLVVVVRAAALVAAVVVSAQALWQLIVDG